MIQLGGTSAYDFGGREVFDDTIIEKSGDWSFVRILSKKIAVILKRGI